MAPTPKKLYKTKGALAYKRQIIRGVGHKRAAQYAAKIAGKK